MIGLNGCKTLEIAHDPLRCIDRPIAPLVDKLDERQITELTNLSDSTFNRLEAHIIAHQKRIESQCNLILKHNRNHEK